MIDYNAKARALLDGSGAHHAHYDWMVNELKHFAKEVLAEAADCFDDRATKELNLSADAKLGHMSRHHAKRAQAFTIAARELRVPAGKEATDDIRTTAIAGSN